MVDTNPMSRRERQIMDIVYAQGSATVREIQEKLDDPPTVMAVRRMVHILEEKGHLKRKKEGREVVYSPKQSKQKAGTNALDHVIETFFGGVVEDALAAHLSKKEEITPEELNRLQKMISEGKEEKQKELTLRQFPNGCQFSWKDCLRIQHR